MTQFIGQLEVVTVQRLPSQEVIHENIAMRGTFQGPVSAQPPDCGGTLT